MLGAPRPCWGSTSPRRWHAPELGGPCAPWGGHMVEEPGRGPTLPLRCWVSESLS